MSATSGEQRGALGPSEFPKKTSGLGPIFLVVFLDILGFSLVLPFLAEEARTSFGTSAFTGTLLASVYSLMQFVFVPVWGRLSDRVGRRPVLLWSIAATAVGMAGLGFGLGYANSVVWLFVARAWGGIATANLGTATAYIADSTRPEDRSAGMGMIGMAFGLGFIIGPAVGGVLSEVLVGGRAGVLPCFLAAVLSCVNLAWVYFGLPESLPPNKRARGTRSLSPLNLTAASEALRQPGVGRAIAVNFTITIFFTILDQTFRFYTKDLFDMRPRQTAYVLAFIGIVAAIVQGGIVRPLAKRYDEAILMRAGTAIQAVAFATMAAAASLGTLMLLLGGGLLALGNGLTQPTVGAFISKRAPASAQGATLGTNQSAAALARVFGPSVGGFLYGSYGPRSPYLLAAAGMAIAWWITLGVARSPKPSS